jgi:hypothetical protein
MLAAVLREAPCVGEADVESAGQFWSLLSRARSLALPSLSLSLPLPLCREEHKGDSLSQLLVRSISFSLLSPDHAVLGLCARCQIG